MDFIVGLPRTKKGYDSIWVIIDRHTKTAHFIPINTIYRAKTYAELYISRIVCLHGIPKTITSDRGPQFVARYLPVAATALPAGAATGRCGPSGSEHSDLILRS